jgi:hypothetical protein
MELEDNPCQIYPENLSFLTDLALEHVVEILAIDESADHLKSKAK